MSVLGLLLAGAIMAHFEGTSIEDVLAYAILLSHPASFSSAPLSTSTVSTEVMATSTTATTSPFVFSNTTDKSNIISATAIIDLTNMERATVANLPPLKENVLLDAAAEMKLNDMFNNQYFAHISPSGVGPGDLALKAGYNYVVEGENLAEGDFTSATNLLNAWMASPGHRANILNVRYINIGVAVRQGMYQGQEVWMAVQEFGKPLSSCPVISAVLHQEIITNQTKATSLSQQLNTIKQELMTTATGTPEENSVYNQIAQDYNGDVTIYNAVVARLKVEIPTYNDEVQAFNACVNS